MILKIFSKAFHCPTQLLTFYLLLWSYLLILKMLTETLLIIPFSVISQCSLVPLIGCKENSQEPTCHKRLPVWFYFDSTQLQAAFCVGNLSPAMGARNQVGCRTGPPARPVVVPARLATQFQTRFLESIPRPIAGLKFSTLYVFAEWNCRFSVFEAGYWKDFQN